MIRSGIILGAIAFVYLLVTNVAMVICAPCEAILLGAFAGFLAAILDKPQTANKAVLRGGIAGLIATIGAVIGNIIGYLLRTFVVFTPQTLSSVTNQLTGAQYSSTESTVMTIAILFCCVIVDLLLMVGMGAFGGFLWFQFKGKNAAAPAPPPIIS